MTAFNGLIVGLMATLFMVFGYLGVPVAFSLIAGSNAFGLGACPGIDYQLPSGDGNHLKTLETGANYVLAAMLLYRETGTAAYLKAAVAKYAAIRKAFLDRAVPLYSVYVFDDGTSCTQVPHRFFGPHLPQMNLRNRVRRLL